MRSTLKQPVPTRLTGAKFVFVLFVFVFYASFESAGLCFRFAFDLDSNIWIKSQFRLVLGLGFD